MFIINMSQLANILDASKFALYTSLKNDIKKPGNELREEYKIDIDSFLIAHKVNSFSFDYEPNGSFSERLKTYNYPEYISAAVAKELLKVNDYQLRKLRINQEIKGICVKKTRYEYETNSILKKVIEIGLSSEMPKYHYRFSKQFYSPVEVIDILKKNGINISLKTLYRYIYQYKKIPCIKVSGILRIPILELEKYVLTNADETFSTLKK